MRTIENAAETIGREMSDLAHNLGGLLLVNNLTRDVWKVGEFPDPGGTAHLGYTRPSWVRPEGPFVMSICPEVLADNVLPFVDSAMDFEVRFETSGWADKEGGVQDIVNEYAATLRHLTCLEVTFYHDIYDDQQARWDTIRAGYLLDSGNPISADPYWAGTCHPQALFQFETINLAAALRRWPVIPADPDDDEDDEEY